VSWGIKRDHKFPIQVVYRTQNKCRGGEGRLHTCEVQDKVYNSQIVKEWKAIQQAYRRISARACFRLTNFVSSRMMYYSCFCLASSMIFFLMISLSIDYLLVKGLLKPLNLFVQWTHDTETCSNTTWNEKGGYEQTWCGLRETSKIMMNVSQCKDHVFKALGWLWSSFDKRVG